jgi:hypothetical protein
LTIKFPTAPASHAATAFAFACVRFHLGFRLGPGAGYRFRARSSPKVGSPWKFHSRFTSDLFQTLRTRLLASSALPQTKLETHLQFFCPSSSSIVKDLSCIRTGAGIAARFRLTPMPRKERSRYPIRFESLRLPAQFPVHRIVSSDPTLMRGVRIGSNSAVTVCFGNFSAVRCR